MRRLSLVLSLLFIGLGLQAQTIVGRAPAITYTFPAVSSTTTTEVLTVSQVAPRKHAIQVNTTGSPTGCAVSLQGSLDGVTFADITSSDVTCTTSGALGFVVDKPVMFVRASVKTLSGGTAPTVTVIYLGSY